MRRQVTKFFFTLLAAGIVWLGAAAPGDAQLRFVTPAPGSAAAPQASAGSISVSPGTVSIPAGNVPARATELESLLLRGRKLESENRWGEAVTLYEEAIRENPSEAGLSNRYELAKIHYDIGRRYHDSSFIRSVSSLEDREAMGLYGELLLKIQSHYVSEPDWAGLVRRGTADLEVALGETQFLRQTNLTAGRPQIDAFRTELVRQLQSRQIRTRQQALDAVNYAAQLARQQLHISATPVILEYACAATGGLDEYSAYLTSDQLNDVYSQIEGNFVGLGIEFKAHEGALLIVKVVTGSPAERGGIRAHDRIVAVGGHSTADLTNDQAADLLQGTEGSVVEVAVQTQGANARRLTLRREHVDVSSIDDVKIIDRDYGVGYIKLSVFQKTTSRELDAALWKLHREGMRSLIMDLRNNPGGLLTASVEVADKFVEEGVIVSTRGRSAMEDYNYTAHKAGTWRVPLVVLIDGDSASASEIFAGAIRDHARGKIVGQRSYGKGSVQGIFPLTTAGAGVRLTTAKFYSPSGKPISKVGVQPDVNVTPVTRVAKPIGNSLPITAEDETLAAGLLHARGITAQR